jgi:hypothetical protein
MSLAGDNMYEIAQGSTSEEWTTTDGVAWSSMTLPSGFEFVGRVQPLPGGGSMAVGRKSNSSQAALLRSDDGVNWQAVPYGAAGTLYSILMMGNVLVASGIPGSPAESSPSDLRIWQSQDWGSTWQPLMGPDGNQLAGVAIPLGNGVAIMSTEAATQNRLTWVGKWSGPSSSPTPQPLHSVAAASTGGTVSPTSIPVAQASDQASGSSCDAAPAWFPALNPNVGGLSGWSVIGGLWAGDGYACSSGSVVADGSDLGMNSAVAVLAACDTGQIMDAELVVHYAGLTDARRVVGSFQVTCPISLSSPQVVFTALDDTMAGHVLEVYVASPVPVKGTFAFMIQTTKALQPAGTTTKP